MDRKKFFDRVRKDFYPNGLTQKQVDGFNALLDQFEKYQWPIAYAANGLSTVRRECGENMQPVREGFKETDAEAREYVKRNYPTKYGKPTVYGGQYAYGRGYVQLTWADPNGIDNYARADGELAERGAILAGELLKDFDLALRPDLAAVIMMDGMEEGWFTGKKLSDYLDKQPPDYRNARRVVNGVDHADEIAANSLKFSYALSDAGYGIFDTAPVQPTAPPEPPMLPVPEVPVSANESLWDRLKRIFG